ncbi:MAG: substrate-binding domain-containing protein [Verrucomicrobia bacterium]|nr:substrate-binding domain-containing protein [Verrucomicrobiota bacterium]
MKIDINIQVADPIHVQVSRQLEQMIRSGRLAEGHRIPPASQLTKQWGVNYKAIHRAMTVLNAAGLIERKQGRGTFVKSPSDKAIVGLLVAFDLLDESAHFYRALVQAVRRAIGEKNWRCLFYDSLDARDDRLRREVLRRFHHDLRHHEFKALIFLGYDTERGVDDEVPQSLPSAAFYPVSTPAYKADVELDYCDFTYAAFSRLARKGCKRIAYFRAFWHSRYVLSRDLNGFADAASAQHLAVTSDTVYQLKGVAHSSGGAFERHAHEKMLEWISNWKTKERPDGLIVSDDILMRGVARALHESAIRVPEQIKVVCATNEGIEHPYVTPITRYEFSPRDIARELVAILWKRIVGRSEGEMPVRVKGRILEDAR